MSYWIAVIGSQLTRDRFISGNDTWFCLPKSCDVGDIVMMYIARKASNNPGVFAQYRVVSKDPCKDNLCSHYGKLSGTGERPVYVTLELDCMFDQPISLKKMKLHQTLSSTVYVRRNFQATYFKITQQECDLIKSLGVAS